VGAGAALLPRQRRPDLRRRHGRQVRGRRLPGHLAGHRPDQLQRRSPAGWSGRDCRSSSSRSTTSSSTSTA
jgi:hypothetical protein